MKEELDSIQNIIIWDDLNFRRKWELQGFNPDILINSQGEKIIRPAIFKDQGDITDHQIEENLHFTVQEKTQIFHLRRIIKILTETQPITKNTLLEIIDDLHSEIIFEYETYDIDQEGEDIVIDKYIIFNRLSKNQIKNIIRVLTYVFFRYKNE